MPKRERVRLEEPKKGRVRLDPPKPVVVMWVEHDGKYLVLCKGWGKAKVAPNMSAAVDIASKHVDPPYIIRYVDPNDKRLKKHKPAKYG